MTRHCDEADTASVARMRLFITDVVLAVAPRFQEAMKSGLTDPAQIQAQVMKGLDAEIRTKSGYRTFVTTHVEVNEDMMTQYIDTTLLLLLQKN